MSNIIEMPVLSEELLAGIGRAYNTVLIEGEQRPHQAAEAALAVYQQEMVCWEPIDPSDIKPGMRVRDTLEGRYRNLQTTFVVTSVCDHYIYAGDSIYPKASPHFWQVDPRTIPADPDKELLDTLRGWVLSPDDARKLLASLREVANITLKAESASEPEPVKDDGKLGVPWPEGLILEDVGHLGFVALESAREYAVVRLEEGQDFFCLDADGAKRAVSWLLGWIDWFYTEHPGDEAKEWWAQDFGVGAF